MQKNYKQRITGHMLRKMQLHLTCLHSTIEINIFQKYPWKMNLAFWQYLKVISFAQKILVILKNNDAQGFSQMSFFLEAPL